MYRDSVLSFLQSAFRACYLGCRSDRTCLQNSPESEVRPHMLPCGGGVFEGVDTLMYTMHSGCNILCLDILFISLSNIWKVH